MELLLLLLGRGVGKIQTCITHLSLHPFQPRNFVYLVHSLSDVLYSRSLGPAPLGISLSVEC